ncbi:3-isopropylmalate dehydratase large subunit [Candidatus Bathyarchaeota archaeon]|nr:3-isopropylmalate dehydratase large subunit [Candidatus Bathyarchaeota archaeon]
MNQNITEKILAYASHNKEVHPGDYIIADVDWVMFHDSTGPLVIKGFESIGKKIFNKNKLVTFFDHFYPAPNIDAAKLHKISRDFIQREEIIHHHTDGVCHQILAEKYVSPGDIVVGADSHTCTQGALGAFTTGLGSTDIAGILATGKCWFKVPNTIKINVLGETKKGVFAKDVILKIASKIGSEGADYSSIEFVGEYIKNATVSDRLTLCNMAVEMGAKNGIIEPDEKTLKFTGREGKIFKSDQNASYEKNIELEVSELSPQISCPHSVDNVKTIEEVEGIPINQAFIGTCTNGRLTDLEITAKILKGKKVNKNVRLIVIPASITVYLEAFNQGILQTILSAGGIVSYPSCGPCIGRHNGVLDEGEVCLSTQNRNFAGRMGSPKSEIYLGSPASVAAASIVGKITDPRKFI